MLECLADLDASLRTRGSRLVVRRGRPEIEIPKLAAQAGARAVHYTGDVSGFARGRDAAWQRRSATPRPCTSIPGLFVVDDLDAIRTQSGTPYTVFTPFHRAWLDATAPAGRRRAPPAPAPAPRRLTPGALPSLSELGLRQEVDDPMPGGEGEAGDAQRSSPPATRRLRREAEPRRRRGRVTPFAPTFTSAACRHASSRSGSTTERFAASSAGATSTPTSSCTSRATRTPSTRRATAARSGGAARTSGSRRGARDGPAIRSSTPAMRQLKREGWMHNRARLVVGSFLTKDLGIDWRWGERWFMRLLLDGDEASNNGNWQWIASVGVDPQPVLPPNAQPGPPAGPLRPRRRIRAPLRARAPRRRPRPTTRTRSSTTPQARREALARYRAS